MDATQVYLENSDRIRSVLFRYGITLQDVDDVAHNVYLKIAQSLNRESAAFRGGAQIGTWVFSIAKNEALMHHRASRRHDARMDRSESSEEFDVADDKAVDALSALAVGEDVARLRAAVNQLDPRSRAALRLHYVDGWSTNDVGRAFGVHETTGKTIIYRARLKLSKLMDCAAREDEAA